MVWSEVPHDRKVATNGAAVCLRQPLIKHPGGLTTTVSDSNGAALLGCSDQRTLARAPSGAAIYQRVRLLPRPFRSAQMQKWQRVGGAGGSLPPVVTVIDWGGGGLVPPDFREIHVIRGDLKSPAEARGQPQAKHRAVTRERCSLCEAETLTPEQPAPHFQAQAPPMHNLFPSRRPGARTTCLRG